MDVIWFVEVRTSSTEGWGVYAWYETRSDARAARKHALKGYNFARIVRYERRGK